MSSRRGRLRAGDTGGDTRATRGNTMRATWGNTTRTTRGNTTRATRGDAMRGKGTSRWDTCEKKGEQSSNEKEKKKKIKNAPGTASRHAFVSGRVQHREKNPTPTRL